MDTSTAVAESLPGDKPSGITTEELSTIINSYKSKPAIQVLEGSHSEQMPCHIWIKKMKFNLPQSYSEVYPNVFLGDGILALRRDELASLGFTHILNCAQGKKESQVSTDRSFYRLWPITFMGVPAHDSTRYDMLQHLPATTTFIKGCIAMPNGKVYVHCHAGVSRSATVVIGFLMLHCSMSLKDAINYVLERRPSVNPNRGFLNQLCKLDQQLICGDFKKETDKAKGERNDRSIMP